MRRLLPLGPSECGRMGMEMGSGARAETPNVQKRELIGRREYLRVVVRRNNYDRRQNTALSWAVESRTDRTRLSRRRRWSVSCGVAGQVVSRASDSGLVLIMQGLGKGGRSERGPQEKTGDPAIEGGKCETDSMVANE